MEVFNIVTIMLIEFEIPDDLAEDMDHFKEVNWNNIVIQSIRGSYS